MTNPKYTFSCTSIFFCFFSRTACHKTVMKIQNLSLKDSLILSDPVSTSLTIQNHHFKKHHPISQQITKILSSFNKTVILFWIPSHSHTSKYDQADQFSKKLTIYIFNLKHFDCSSHLKNMIKADNFVYFSDYWNQICSTN